MKHILFAVALLTPGLAAAYPNPNVTISIAAGDLVDSIWTQPKPAPLILAENGAK
ncbi:hypothetical protein [Marivita hallyeonensis]|uniref:Uncharacterized protein n=1 Tax=Marivita hallyeonensis TaxID=996342 RepID=A0A1M5MS67_9RHOB|nr:hypothetical protein [Marivita hallyeonensis]SHG80121.1 hypothetical protein SAMN05443551_0631 [Marivita hallyeonensis]